MTLKDMWLLIKQNVSNHGGKSFPKSSYVYLFDARFRLVLNYRLGFYFNSSTSFVFELFAKYYKYWQVTQRNCDISYNAIVRRDINFHHLTRIIIGYGIRIGDIMQIYQHVTLGTNGKVDGILKNPIIMKNIQIYDSPVIASDVQVEENTIIGALSFIKKSIRPNSIAVGSPAIIKDIN